MSKTKWLWLLPACVTGLFVKGLMVTPLHSQSINSTTANNLAQANEILAPVDLIPVLPADVELPDFYNYQATGRHTLSPRLGQVPTASATMDATRSDHSLSLSIQLGVTATPSEALELAHEAINTPGGIMPEGSPSGHPVGQLVWHSRYYDGGLPRGGYHLIAYDGRAVVIVLISTPLQGYQDGKPVEAVLSAQDIQMTEDIASACLTRIGYLGFTSQPALNASAKKQFIIQRMALIHPAKQLLLHTAHK